MFEGKRVRDSDGTQHNATKYTYQNGKLTSQEITASSVKLRGKIGHESGSADFNTSNNPTTEVTKPQSLHLTALQKK